MTAPRFPTPEAFLGERAARVHLVGAGGTGSMLADHLGRLDCALRAQGHPGLDVTVFDDALVRPANIGRQRFAHSDVGFYKAVTLAQHINDLYGVVWKTELRRYGTKERAPDLVVGCVDLGRFRYNLGKAWKGKTTSCLWLDTGNGSDRGQALIAHLGQPSSGLRLPNIFDLYGRELLSGDDDDLPSCSLAEALTRQHWSVNPTVAVVAAELLDNLFHHGGLDHHGGFVRLQPLSIQSIPVDPSAWELLGYRRARARKAA